MYNDEYVNMCCSMIMGDFEKSPYTSIGDYWEDHWRGWYAVFDAQFFQKVEKQLCLDSQLL